jgi:hypothetical protein
MTTPPPRYPQRIVISVLSEGCPLLRSQAAKEALVALQIKFKSRYVIQQFTPGGVANFPQAKDFEVCSINLAILGVMSNEMD